MKEFINYLSNQGVNFNVIITDIDFWVIIILIVAASEVIRRVRILTREYDEIFKKLLSAESKIEDKCAELFASSHINDCLSVENSLLKQLLENAERKLLKYNFKRDSKGKFVSQDPYYYAKKIAKRKKWFTDSHPLASNRIQMKSYQLIQGECESCIFASKGCGYSVGHEECLDTDNI